MMEYLIRRRNFPPGRTFYPPPQEMRKPVETIRVYLSRALKTLRLILERIVTLGSGQFPQMPEVTLTRGVRTRLDAIANDTIIVDETFIQNIGEDLDNNRWDYIRRILYNFLDNVEGVIRFAQIVPAQSNTSRIVLMCRNHLATINDWQEAQKRIYYYNRILRPIRPIVMGGQPPFLAATLLDPAMFAPVVRNYVSMQCSRLPTPDFQNRRKNYYTFMMKYYNIIRYMKQENRFQIDMYYPFTDREDESIIVPGLNGMQFLPPQIDLDSLKLVNYIRGLFGKDKI
jgi:hypothetical protein